MDFVMMLVGVWVVNEPDKLANTAATKCGVRFFGCAWTAHAFDRYQDSSNAGDAHVAAKLSHLSRRTNSRVLGVPVVGFFEVLISSRDPRLPESSLPSSLLPTESPKSWSIHKCF
jgi:hypothetical protein